MEDIIYKRDKFYFIYRVSAVIFNKDKTKILLFYGNDSDYYMLPGGKVHELENSQKAIEREILEELGFKNLKFDFIGISEEIVKDKDFYVHQLTLTYKCIYEGEIIEQSFKSIESDWINFKWIDLDKIKNYNIHPRNIIQIIRNNDFINHIVEVNI